jgi:hypothetical protein
MCCALSWHCFWQLLWAGICGTGGNSKSGNWAAAKMGPIPFGLLKNSSAAK